MAGFYRIFIVPERVLLVEFAWVSQTFPAAAPAILAVHAGTATGALAFPVPPIIRMLADAALSFHAAVSFRLSPKAARLSSSWICVYVIIWERLIPVMSLTIVGCTP